MATSFTAVAHVDFADDEGPSDTAKSDADHVVQLFERQRAGFRKYTAEIDERRHLDIDPSRDGIEGQTPSGATRHRLEKEFLS